MHIPWHIQSGARTIELHIYERTNVPGNSERTWTPLHHPQHLEHNFEVDFQVEIKLQFFLLRIVFLIVSKPV